jgi:hypothetical protein
MTKIERKISNLKKLNFVDQKLKFIYSFDSMNAFQAAGEALNNLNRTCPLKTWNFLHFLSFLWVSVACLDPDPDSQSSVDQDPETRLIPDPEHCPTEWQQSLKPSTYL